MPSITPTYFKHSLYSILYSRCVATPGSLNRLATLLLLKQGDADLARAWVEDLKTVGYRFPKRQKRRPDAPAAKATHARTPAGWRRYNAIVLVVNFNKAYDG